MAYSFVEHNGETFETCDECGFHGGLISSADAVRRLHTLGGEWRAIFALYPELTRERPTPETWCPVEYAVHLIFVARANEHQAHLFC